MSANPIGRIVLAGIDALSINATVQLEPNTVEGLKRAMEFAKSRPERTFPVFFGESTWFVHATGTRSGHTFRLTNNYGRTLLLRDLGPKIAEHFSEDDIPPDSEAFRDPACDDEPYYDPPWTGKDEPIDFDPLLNGSDDENSTEGDVGEAPDRKAHYWNVTLECDSEGLWALAANPTKTHPPERNNVIERIFHELAYILHPDQRLVYRETPLRSTEVRLGRIDLCADTTIEFRQSDLDNFRGYAKSRRSIEYRDRSDNASVSEQAAGEFDYGELHQTGGGSGFFSGLTFGKGDRVLRIYDKSREIGVSGKDFFRHIWERVLDGVVIGPRRSEGQTPIWRVEIQLRGAALKALGLRHLEVAWNNDALKAAWMTTMSRHLRLVLPDSSNPNRRTDRLVLDPRWEITQEAFGRDAAIIPPCPRPFPNRTIESTAIALRGPLASFGAAVQANSAEKILHKLARRLDEDPDLLTEIETISAERAAEQLSRLASTGSPTIRRIIGWIVLALAESMEPNPDVETTLRTLAHTLDDIDAKSHVALMDKLRKAAARYRTWFG